MIFKNKKGDEKMLSIWMFIIWFIIVFFIALGVYLFYSANFDSKSIHADVLSQRIERCLIQGGYLTSDITNENFDLFSKCNIRRVEWINFKIEFLKNDKTNLREPILFGGSDFETQCALQDVSEAKNYPGCSLKEINALINKGGSSEQVLVKIKTASNLK